MPGTRGRKAEVDRNHMRINEVIGTWFQMVLVGVAWLGLTACIASQTGPVGLQPANDRILLAGDIQVAETHLRDFGFDPGPVDGIFTAETRAAVRAYQARYGLPVSGLLDYPIRRELLPGLDQPGIVR
ncbi:MAG: peptidoglycan-binding protein [Candidatus Tectomicrobia bacterium]|nr:peptidoglycan-binding protein [Candidatus Tectomicrobia bacterium]